MLLGHSPTRLLRIVCSCGIPAAAELGSCSRGHMAGKASNGSCLALYGKSRLTASLGDLRFSGLGNWTGGGIVTEMGNSGRGAGFQGRGGTQVRTW